jgi:hypothetical protein
MPLEPSGEFLGKFEPRSPVAVETVGNWYWIIGEIEEAGMVPRPVHARQAKMMLSRQGTKPTGWMPGG